AASSARACARNCAPSCTRHSATHLVRGEAAAHDRLRLRGYRMRTGSASSCAPRRDSFAITTPEFATERRFRARTPGHQEPSGAQLDSFRTREGLIMLTA